MSSFTESGSAATLTAPTLVSSQAPRLPAQERSQQRVQAALAAAERIVVERGPEQLSIPEVALAAGVPRASLYPFFPDKYSLLASLAEQHLARITALIEQATEARRFASLTEMARAISETAADYYSAHPAASILVLGGPWTRSGGQAQEHSVARVGEVVRALLQRHLPELPIPRRPDVATLAVEISFACMKHGYQQEGLISESIRFEAVRAAVAYCEACLPGLGAMLAEAGA